MNRSVVGAQARRSAGHEGPQSLYASAARERARGRWFRVQWMHQVGVMTLDQWFIDCVETDWRYVERYYLTERLAGTDPRTASPSSRGPVLVLSCWWLLVGSVSKTPVVANATTHYRTASRG